MIAECIKLKKLKVLILDVNNFSNDMLPFLSVFTELETLSLVLNRFEGAFPVEKLSALKNLKHLDLSFNSFNGSVGLSKFKKLETLNLAGNQFDRNVVESLRAVTSLKNLDLRYNSVEEIGPFPNNIVNLKNLENLDLSYNLLNGSLPIKELSKLNNLKIVNLGNNLLTGPLHFEELTTLKKLEILDLSNNQLSGYISPSIGSMVSLRALSLANNKLNGSLPQQGLCELKNLEELDLSQNNLSGVLPACLSSLTSLKLLDLSFNRLEGNISSTLQMSKLSTLEYIDIRYNRFEGSFSFSSVANHTNLKVVMIGSADNKLEVETEHSSWLPSFQLTILAIPNCKLHKLPKFLIHQFNLRVVDLSHNNLTGIFPDWLVENNTNLEFLSLRNNSFFSQLHLPPDSRSNIVQMDISDNHFHGQLQENIGYMLPKILFLNVSENSFEGSISSVCNLPLFLLDLSNNNFSGEITDKFAENCSSLTILKLSNNKLHGRIPNFNQSQLMSLQLNGNEFTGRLPNWISQSTRLYNIDVSGNYLSGEIPSFLSNKSISLLAISMSDNAFEGKISCELLDSVVLLDLSHNSLSGPLPSCDFQNLNYLNLQGNQITGSIPGTLFNYSYLLTLNLKDNLLSGEIPTSNLGYSDMRVLLLGGNLLSGLIPDQLCQLNRLSMLDLSNNSFTGSIPSCFSNITFGKVMKFDSLLKYLVPIPIPRFPVSDSGFEGLLLRDIMHEKNIDVMKRVEVEFISKTRTNIYKGSILDLMSGLDLSCNQLTGEIPPEIGQLRWIRALNLSHNQLTGSIPITFGSFIQMESLDLSYNNLSGEIPSTLINLNFLQVFSVAHNNLSGRVPDAKAQFGTFENNVYEGNPFLCGPQLGKSCSPVIESPSLVFSDSSDEKWYEIDPVVFKASFTVAYAMFFLVSVALLYINPNWRRKLVDFVEDCAYSCFFFVSGALRKLST